MQVQIECGLRPCRVATRVKTLHGRKINVQEGLFHRWTSEQWTYSPVMQGQVGGQMQSTYGIVELQTGEVRMFSPDQIQFLDNKSAEYAFPETDQKIRLAVNVLRIELMKHDDLYNGFLASIESVLKEIPAGMGTYDVAEKILNGLIGEE